MGQQLSSPEGQHNENLPIRNTRSKGMKFIPAFNHVQVIVGESTDELIALTMVLLDTLQDVGLLQRCYQYYSDRLQFRHPHSIRLLKMELYDGSRGLQMPVFGGTIQPWQRLRAQKVNTSQLCSLSMFSNASNHSSSLQLQLRLYQQYYNCTLAECIVCRGKQDRPFEEKQLWSLLSSCCLAANELLRQGYKQPILSPHAIKLDARGMVHVAEWEFTSFHDQNSSHCNSSDTFFEQGETFDGQKHCQTGGHSHGLLTDYYWPPEGMAYLQAVTSPGIKGSIGSRCEQVGQVFSLGLTLAHMCLLQPQYQQQTFSEKRLQGIVCQAVQFREQISMPLSDSFKDVLTRMLKWDPSERINYQDLGLLAEHWIVEEGASCSYIGQDFDVSAISGCEDNWTESRIEESKAFMVARLTGDGGSGSIDQGKGDIQSPAEETSASVRETSIEGRGGSVVRKMLENTGNDKWQIDYERINYTLEPQKNVRDSKGLSYGLIEPVQTIKKSTKVSVMALFPCFPLCCDQQDYREQAGIEQMCFGGQSQCTDDQADVQQTAIVTIQEGQQVIKQLYLNTIDCNLPNKKLGIGCYNDHHCVGNIFDQRNLRLNQRNLILDQRNLKSAKCQPQLVYNSSKNYNRRVDVSQAASAFNGIPHECQQLKTQMGGVNSVNITSFELKDSSVTDNNEQLFTDPKLLAAIRQSVTNFAHDDARRHTLHDTFSCSFNSAQSSHEQIYQQQYVSEHKHIVQQMHVQQHIVEQVHVQQHNDRQYLEDAYQDNNVNMKDNVDNDQLSKYSLKKSCSLSEIFDKSGILYVKEQFAKGYYQGAKSDNMRNGYGTFYYKQGGKYCGDWVRNRMHGNGTLYYADGRIAYQGQWRADSLSGKGILYNENPTRLATSYDYSSFDESEEYWVYYNGSFFKDDKFGKGVLLLSNGEKYEGDFRNDMIEGRGVFHMLDGSKVHGQWSANKLVRVIKNEQYKSNQFAANRVQRVEFAKGD